MKIIKILFLSVHLFAISNIDFSQQCPPSVLKIQSPICDTPKNLSVSNIKCTSAQLNWQGNKEQKYIVAAIGTGNTLFEIDSAKYSCDENGNCSANIDVKEGITLNWNVQAICNINGVTIYSPKVEGKEMVVPYCQSIAANAKTDSSNATFRVYPNPTTGNLNVEYYSKVSGTVRLKVIDVNGKTLYIISNDARTGNNNYSLNLRNLSPGTYVLELSSNGNVEKVKFVLVGK